jgi:hypothetical protein
MYFVFEKKKTTNLNSLNILDLSGASSINCLKHSKDHSLCVLCGFSL